MSPPLSPAQSRTLTALAKPAAGLPVFRDDLGVELEAWITAELADTVAGWTGEELFIGKGDISSLAGGGECERKVVLGWASPFTRSISMSVGTLAHKMAQLRLMAGTLGMEPELAEVWAWAYESCLAEEYGLGKWLEALPDGDLVDLSAQAQEQYASFLDTFPVARVGKKWLPVAEVKVKWQCGPFVYSGKVDLQFGRLYGDEGTGAGRGQLDIKGGKVSQTHLVQQRLYSLLTAIKTGVPPRLAGVLSLADGRLSVEPVTEDMLWQTAQVLVNGTRRAVALRLEPELAVPRTGGLCGRYCEAANNGTCPEGAAHVRR